MQNTGNSSCWGIARVYVNELGFVFVGGDDSALRNLFAMQIGLSVGRGGLLPPFPPPLTRGLSNAQHLTGGEKQADISSLPPSFAYGKSHLPPRGRNNGADPAPRCRGGFPRPPVDLDVILRNNTEVVPYS